MSNDHPITPAIRFLREKKVEFVPHLYDYVEKGGARESARQLGVDVHAVVKTLVFETNERKPLIVLMHGDREVSTKNLARFLGVKSVESVTP
ncbi:MAG: Cys-tRNA(Pro) deacylase, partial [Blastocatellia bacterium]|nr:Cys-tRNA(Pro) deacylase [Blastocatellia bacterium]